MPIPESQLERWSNLGSTVNSAGTYASITKALSECSKLQNKNYQVYLQGSYRNSTNIWGNSDVDVVVELQDCFNYDVTNHDPVMQALNKQQFSSASYGFWDFRADIAMALVDYYGVGLVTPGEKCLKVKGNGTRLNADVVVSISHRRYRGYASPQNSNYVEGICISTNATPSRDIVNFPKLHYGNGAAKNQRVGEFYKPTTRIVKNMRRYLVENNYLTKDHAPSYFLECLLYNVPDHCYGGYQPHTARVYNTLNWLTTRSDLSTFPCQNGQVYLFGQSPEQWNVAVAQRTINALGGLWQQWPL